LERNHRGMHASLDATGMTLRVSDELDRETQFARVAEVDGFDPLDALAKDAGRPPLDLIRDGREHGELRGGVEAADVVGRSGVRRLLTSRTSTLRRQSSTPARRESWGPHDSIRSATWEPTVPRPMRPTLRGRAAIGGYSPCDGPDPARE